MERKEKWGERDGREEREFIYLYYLLVYSLCYFNELYVKIETEMLGEL